MLTLPSECFLGGGQREPDKDSVNYIILIIMISFIIKL